MRQGGGRRNVMVAVWVAVAVLGMSVFGFADVLPDLPDHLEDPFPNAEIYPLTDAGSLQHLFAEVNYELDRVFQDKTAPRIFVANIPQDLNSLPVHKKTSAFIRMLLTSVIKVNDHTLAVRHELKYLADKHLKGTTLSERELEWLRKVSENHYCRLFDFSEMLKRIDVLPVGLTLAQAIDESGWGTSRFAREGNSLYGQHLPENSSGKYLTTPDGSVKVAAFDNLYHSTASYLHNINTSKAYAALRDERAFMRKKYGNLNGMNLARALEHYSTRGKEYVDDLRWLIKHYRLDAFEDIVLEEANANLLVVFP